MYDQKKSQVLQHVDHMVQYEEMETISWLKALLFLSSISRSGCESLAKRDVIFDTILLSNAVVREPNSTRTSSLALRISDIY